MKKIILFLSIFIFILVYIYAREKETGQINNSVVCSYTGTGIAPILVNPPSASAYYIDVHPNDMIVASNSTFYWGTSNIQTNAIDDWDGELNTNTITGILGNWNSNSTSYPAKICEDLFAFGCNDWYLPSKNEQAAMQASFVSTGDGNFLGAYWSSTENSNHNSAWTTNFNNSNLTQNIHAKDLLYNGSPHDKCRCIRKSSCSTSSQITVNVTLPNGSSYSMFVHPADITIGSNSTFYWGENHIQTNAIDDWDGEANTNTITGILGNWNSNSTSYPAKICEDLVAFGCDDWYLPSKNELAAMQANFVSSGNGNYSGAYWSSTENLNRNSAWTTNFNNSILTQNIHAKDLLYNGSPHDKCRCVRKNN